MRTFFAGRPGSSMHYFQAWEHRPGGLRMTTLSRLKSELTLVVMIQFD